MEQKPLDVPMVAQYSEHENLLKMACGLGFSGYLRPFYSIKSSPNPAI
jgi:hypothetical protein